jgi:hypothetical protein
MTRGIELRDAIANNLKLRGVENCPLVPVSMSAAIYGRPKDDVNQRTLDNEDKAAGATEKKIYAAMGFGGAQSETVMWHFQTAPFVHHFAVLAWYDEANQELCYSAFMAFERLKPHDPTKPGYSFAEYVDNSMVPQLPSGYPNKRNITQLTTWLKELLTDNAAWSKYFQAGVEKKIESLSCWKYDFISLDKAMANVMRY